MLREVRKDGRKRVFRGNSGAAAVRPHPACDGLQASAVAGDLLHGFLDRGQGELRALGGFLVKGAQAGDSAHDALRILERTRSIRRIRLGRT